MSVVLGDLETRKDRLQMAVDSGFQHVGQIAAIVAGAGRQVTQELGDWATELFEMREAAERARQDRERSDDV
jgi:hypothetical protein